MATVSSNAISPIACNFAILVVGEVLTYMGSVGMCGPKGMFFERLWAEMGTDFHYFGLK